VNFRLKRLDVSTDERDPGLNHGYAYIVEEKAFKAYLQEYSSRVPLSPPLHATTMMQSSRQIHEEARGWRQAVQEQLTAVDMT
jgi:hypothetical protein